MFTKRENKEPSSKRTERSQALILSALALPFLIGLYVLVLAYWAHPSTPGTQLRLDQFLGAVTKGRVQSAVILADDDRIVGTYDGGSRYWVEFAGGHESLFARLTEALEAGGVPTSVRRQPLKSVVGPVTTLLPALIVIDGFAVLFLVSRRGGDLGGFGRSGARRSNGGTARVTFADLAGVDEAVAELAEVRDYLADPSRFTAMGAAVPKGVLLEGPPGCGKTRLARAVAGESDVPFFSLSGAEFVEMYVGVGAARIRDLFATAKAAAPAIVFIDEVDALGRARGASAAGGSDEREATLNQLLVEMDGFDGGSGVVVIAATNRADILDAALLRPGRFDRRVHVDPPDRAGRQAILALHAGTKPLAADVDLASVAARTVGFSGADLGNVVNEAALLATRAGSATIDARHFSEAIERVVAGPSRPSRAVSPDERRRIAYHEAGHAVVATALAGADPVAKVSIVSRGHGGGYTLYAPEGDRTLATRSQLRDRAAALLGGRAAEEVVFGEPSTGAADDLARATDIARRMVWELGMSDALGPVVITGAAPSGEATSTASAPLAALADHEVRSLLDDAASSARAALEANLVSLRLVAEQLLEAESLEGDALHDTLAGVRPIWDGIQAAPAEIASARPAAA
jgi:cell division protease FtsH